MRRRGLAILLLLVATSLAGAISVASAGHLAANAAAACKVLVAPGSLGKALLGLHRAYERHQPDVHNPRITGPVGRVRLGICGTTRYTLASFDARYNGLYFGIEDQPERFVARAGKGWRDIGNTGGNPCGSAPTALLVAWKIVRSCPG